METTTLESVTALKPDAVHTHESITVAVWKVQRALMAANDERAREEESGSDGGAIFWAGVAAGVALVLPEEDGSRRHIMMVAENCRRAAGAVGRPG
jgi:hypothetical protein